jgi:hypothetical protein
MALLAVECDSAGIPPRVVIGRTEATALVDALAADLARHEPGVGTLDLVGIGAVYDQAQLLRPGWPLHAALGEAAFGMPGDASSARILALGAHGGRMPSAMLKPERELLGSPMLVLPWLLTGVDDVVAAVGRRLEEHLLERGHAGAALALALGDAFGVKVTHARHMTALDLCALTCAQYEHAGLGAVWQMVEAALLAPQLPRDATLPNGDRLAWRDGIVASDTRDARLRDGCALVLAAHGLALSDSAID